MNPGCIPFFHTAIAFCKLPIDHFHFKLSLVSACQSSVGELMGAFYLNRVKDKIIKRGSCRSPRFDQSSGIHSSNLAGTQVSLYRTTRPKVEGNYLREYAWL